MFMAKIGKKNEWAWTSYAGGNVENFFIFIFVFRYIVA